MKLIMRKANDCIFCRIVEKTVLSKIYYEDDDIMAFQDIEPRAPIHCLIIPKVHIKSMKDIRPEHFDAMGKIFYVANKLADQFGISESGFRLINNCGADAHQSVFHLHVHLIGGKDLGSKVVKRD